MKCCPQVKSVTGRCERMYAIQSGNERAVLSEIKWFVCEIKRISYVCESKARVYFVHWLASRSAWQFKSRSRIDLQFTQWKQDTTHDASCQTQDMSSSCRVLTVTVMIDVRPSSAYLHSVTQALAIELHPKVKNPGIVVRTIENLFVKLIATWIFVSVSPALRHEWLINKCVHMSTHAKQQLARSSKMWLYYTYLVVRNCW